MSVMRAVAQHGPAFTIPHLLALVCIVLLFVIPLGLPEYAAFVLTTGALSVIAVLGLHVLTHWAGQWSLGHVAFVGLGAFVTASAGDVFDLPFLLALLVGMAAAVLATVIIGFPALRIRGPYLAITTIAFGLAVDRWLFPQDWLSGGSAGRLLPPPAIAGLTFGDSSSFYYPVLLLTLLVIVVVLKLGRSKAGRALRVIREDEDLAAAWGINVAAYKLLAFAIAGGLGALAGGLQAYALGIVGPQTFPMALSIQYVGIIVIGGPGSIAGTVLSAASFGILPSIQSVFGVYSPLIGAVGILGVLTAFPGGLNEEGRFLAKQARRRLSRFFPSSTPSDDVEAVAAQVRGDAASTPPQNGSS